MKRKIYFTDGSGYNLDSSAIGIYCPETEYKYIKIYYEDLEPIHTETLALLSCLRMCTSHSVILIDCKILFGYVRLDWKTHLEYLKPMIEEIKNLIKEKDIELWWLPREWNLAGKILEDRRFKIQRYRRNCILTRWSR